MIAFSYQINEDFLRYVYYIAGGISSYSHWDLDQESDGILRQP